MFIMMISSKAEI